MLYCRERMSVCFCPLGPLECSTSVRISPYRPQQASPSPFVKPTLQTTQKKIPIIQATSIPAFPEQQPRPQAEKRGLLQNPDPSSRPSLPQAHSSSSCAFVINGKWPRDDETSLDRCEALPLPMTYPGSTPAPQEVENMKNCDPEIKDCRDVIYQWTGECTRCQGTGEISFYRKKGREVICKCITCLGLGHVHKVTSRTDITIVEEADDTS